MSAEAGKLTEAEREALRAAIDWIKANLPLDGSGHIADCGDAIADCSCATLPERLIGFLAEREAQLRAEIADQAGDTLAGDETDLIDAVEGRIRSLLLGDLDDDGPHRVAAAAVDECLKYLTPKENLRRAFGQAFDSGVRVERSGQANLLADQPDAAASKGASDV